MQDHIYTDVYTDVYLFETYLQNLVTEASKTAGCLKYFDNLSLGERVLKMNEDPLKPNQPNFDVGKNPKKAINKLQEISGRDFIKAYLSLIDLNHKMSGCRKYVKSLVEDLSKIPRDCFKDKEMVSFVSEETDRIANSILAPARLLLTTISSLLRQKVIPEANKLLRDPKFKDLLNTKITEGRQEIKGKTIEEVLRDFSRLEKEYEDHHLEKTVREWETLDNLTEKLPMVATISFAASYLNDLANRCGFSLREI